MPFYAQVVAAMPTSSVQWRQQVNLKTPNKDDKLGYIDPINRGTTFRIVAATEEPLTIKGVRTPFDCFNVADCINKGRGKLTVRVQLNKLLWESLHHMDTVFAEFLVTHRQKLFSASDADYIGRDNSAIKLKMKCAAPLNIDGTPQYDGFVTVRINGRCTEIEEMTVKDGSSGRYVSEVTWGARTSPLLASATRISVVVGVGLDGKPIVRDTLNITTPVPAGGQRVRYVGPGDISSKGALLRYGLMRAAYWSIAPGGGASITYVFDNMVVQNLSSEDASSAEVMALDRVPEGFAAYDESDAIESALIASSSDKRRRLQDDDSSPVARFPVPTSVPGAPRRAVTGGTGFRLTSTEEAEERHEHARRLTAMDAEIAAQLAYDAKMEAEHQQMKRSNAISAAGAGAGAGTGETFQCTQQEAYALPTDESE